MWPDYCTREVLAKRLGVEPGYIDQLEVRGLLPPKVMIGEAMRWRWSDVDEVLRRGQQVVTNEDPYLAGVANAKIAPARRAQKKPPRGSVLLPDQAPGNR